jgi:hypothetical protein
MFGLITLPYEVLSNIIENISFDDVFHLAQTCKHFKYLLTEESISKSIVQVSKLSVWGHARGVMVQSDMRLAAADTVHRQKFLIPMKPWPQ